MISSVLPATNGHHPQPWLKETVQSFFEGFTWSGMAPTSLASPSPSGGVSSEAMATLTVGQFFETFPWEGQPTIGLPITPLEAPQAANPALPADDLTLDDFSSLFG